VVVVAGKNLNPASLDEAAARYPDLAKAVRWTQERLDIERELRVGAGALAARISVVLGGSVRFVIHFVIMLVMLFYFLRDRAKLVNLLRRLVPLSASETDELFRRLSETIHAMLYGSVAVKLLQGFAGGLMFWILGLPAPLLSGIVMATAALVPVVGTAVVWAPAAIVLLAQGSWIKALVLSLWGLLVVGLLDNFLYPVLVASELRLHTLGVFISMFGGALAFGISGVLIGPVILASTVALLEVWRLRSEHQSDLRSEAPPPLVLHRS
jgi:predicted PurR-regulated permease PerM